MAKAKRKVKRGKGNDGSLATFLRFEIVVVLFSLIGLYYFLSFSPIRMPSKPIASAPEMIAPLPVKSEAQAELESAADEQTVETEEITSATEPVTAGSAVSISETQPVEKVDEADIEVENAGPSDQTAAEIGETQVVSNLDIEDNDSLKDAKRDHLPSAAAVVSAEVASVTVSTPKVEPALKTEPLLSSASEKLPESALSQKKKVTRSRIKKIKPLLPTPKTIVVGEYVLEVNLLQAQNKLEKLNFEYKTKVVRQPTSMYRVYLGTFADRQKALAVMDVVRKKGDEPFLQECSGGYNVVIGSFYLKSSVVAWENMYSEAGYKPQVQEVVVEMPHTLLLLTGAEVQNDSEAILSQLRDAGLQNSHLQ